ncbi:amidohydrolase family protein [Congregibacter litoralis]|uniref:Imidazolonepropionase n=1 Tax=Congregibacter litoralis KT71 TaxID=314285 RepID=A4AB63_9GAMM|nr:amidohydrolase family protein [Congregibacter litoralis]EAQ96617.1 Imidazolonepropionase [Congregibacter litoralis KT71]
MKTVANAFFIAVLLPLLLFARTAVALTAIVGGTVVDLEGGVPLKDAVILVEGERITAVGSKDAVAIPEDASTVDATGQWIIPGLMNMHVHPGLILPGKMANELSDETDAALALRMAAAARGMLSAGVTTIRIPGDDRHADLALDRSIRKGESIGPRIFSAGESVIITGGHGSSPGVLYADGPDELVKAARQQISLGASWVKILISGGIATDGGDIAEALMTPEEINAVVDAAHRYGARVAAHSGSSAATTVAVDAGVDSIEHGYTLDKKVLQKMKSAGTWLVPTIVVSQPATAPFFERIGSPQWYLDRRDSVGQQHWEALRTAIAVGVNIGLGTDQLPQEPNDGTTATVREAEYYVEAGMTPLESLRSATIQTAKMLGEEDSLGSIAEGKYADLLFVDADPAQDISALRRIHFVMKGGAIYRDDHGLAP